MGRKQDILSQRRLAAFKAKPVANPNLLDETAPCGRRRGLALERIIPDGLRTALQQLVPQIAKKVSYFTKNNHTYQKSIILSSPAFMCQSLKAPLHRTLIAIVMRSNEGELDMAQDNRPLIIQQVSYCSFARTWLCNPYSWLRRSSICLFS